MCTTELGYMAWAPRWSSPERNCKVLGLSVDSVEDHQRWKEDIAETQGHAVDYPMIGDEDLTVAKLYDMIHPNAAGGKGRTALDNMTVRSVFVVGPDKRVKLILTYPMTTGAELRRGAPGPRLDAAHRFAHQVATPVNWRDGDEVIIVPAVSDEAARDKYPDGWRAPKP